MPREVTAPARRLLGLLAGVPACVCDASWTVLEGNQRWAGLGCGGALPGRHSRNVAWRLFTGAPTAMVQSAEDRAWFWSWVVADLRAAARRYPADRRLRDLAADLRAASGEFARLWSVVGAGRYHPGRLSIDHRSWGRVRLDTDVLRIEPGDVRVVVRTTAAR